MVYKNVEITTISQEILKNSAAPAGSPEENNTLKSKLFKAATQKSTCPKCKKAIFEKYGKLSRISYFLN